MAYNLSTEMRVKNDKEAEPANASGKIKMFSQIAGLEFLRKKMLLLIQVHDFSNSNQKISNWKVYQEVTSSLESGSLLPERCDGHSISYKSDEHFQCKNSSPQKSYLLSSHFNVYIKLLRSVKTQEVA